MGTTAKKIWPIIVIVGLWVIFSFPYFFRGLVPFPSTYLVSFFPPWSSEYGMAIKNNAMPDVITQIYPWKKLTIDSWKMGQIPLWNPYSFSGTPHAGNYQSAVFSPINLLFFILPFIDAWSMMILLQPLLAGICMYMFVRSLDRSKEASLISSIAFMFCGFMVVWMAYGTLGYAALFLPLIFWGINTKKRLVIGIGIALSLLSGHFQVSLYVILAALMFSIWLREWKAVLAVLAGILLASPQIFLGLKSFFESTRGLSVVRGEIIPWQYLITFVAPDFFGNPVTRNDWFGHYAEWAGFIGVTPLILAIIASFTKKSKQGWFFVLFGVITLLFALPTPLNSLLYLFKIPVLSGSAASRIIILASFSFATLSAFGMDSASKNKKIILLLFVGLVCVWLVLLGIKPLPAESLLIAKRNFLIPSIIFCLTLILLLPKKHGMTIFLLIALTSFDMVRFATKWMPFDPRNLVYPEIKSLTKLKQIAGSDRVFGNIGAGEVGTNYRIPLVEGYDAVYPARYGELLQTMSQGYVSPGARSVVLFDKNGIYRTEALQLLGIKYIYHRLSDGHNVWTFPFWEYPSMHVLYGDSAYEIYEYPDTFPRVRLISSYIIGGVNELFDKNFDRKNSVVLEEEPAIHPSSGSGEISIELYTPNRITIHASAMVPKLLLLSDAYDTGWNVTVDGRKEKIYRADYDFRAVALPEGNHTIEFHYQPKEFLWGIIGTIVGLVALCIIL